MTQPEHPFTDLPEGAVVAPFEPRSYDHEGRWLIFFKNAHFHVNVAIEGLGWIAGLISQKGVHLTEHRPTPDAAFQALRQAVRELANDLGVV